MAHPVCKILSLHDALPIWRAEDEFETGKLSLEAYLDRTVFFRDRPFAREQFKNFVFELLSGERAIAEKYGSDRKSTRLNSSHGSISYAVFCLKKKTNKEHT